VFRARGVVFQPVSVRLLSDRVLGVVLAGAQCRPAGISGVFAAITGWRLLSITVWAKSPQDSVRFQLRFPWGGEIVRGQPVVDHVCELLLITTIVVSLVTRNRTRKNRAEVFFLAF